jgi:hypothetical protein
MVLRNRYLSTHAVVYVRDVRVKAYTQFLDAYLRSGSGFFYLCVCFVCLFVCFCCCCFVFFLGGGGRSSSSAMCFSDLEGAGRHHSRPRVEGVGCRVAGALCIPAPRVTRC